MNSEIEKLKDIIRMLEADKRLLAKNIKKLRKDKKYYEKRIKELEEQVDYLNSGVQLGLFKAEEYRK